MRFRAAPIALLILLLARLGAAGTPPVQDVCIGNGTSGPYVLSWKHIEPRTETVTINGLTQIRGLDYTLDTDSGAITFTRGLPASSAAQITYDRDLIQSQRNGEGQIIPLSVDLLRGQHGYFSFNALGKSGDSAKSDLTVGIGIGLNGGANTQLSTRFFYAPVSAASDAETESPARRMGLSIAGSAGAGQWGLFSFGFARAGVNLGDTNDGSLQAGQQTLTLGSRLTPTKQVQADFQFRQSRPTDDPAAETTDNTSLALTVTPNDKTQVQANVAQSETGAGGATQTLNLSASARPTAQMQVNAFYDGQNAPGTADDSQAIALKTILTPAKTLSLETNAAHSQLGMATTNRQTVSVTLTPHAALQLNAGFALRQTDTPGSDPLGTAVASVGGALRPFSFLEFSGSYKNRIAPATDTDVNDQFDSSAAKISLSPLKTVHLVGTYAENPDDGNATLQRLAKHGIGLETSLGALGLSGGCDWSRQYDSPDLEQTVHADLGLRFSAATNLTVGFQTRQNTLDASTPPDTAYTVGFTHAMGDRFSLSLNGKRRQTATAQPDYDASANLGMKF